MWNVYVLLCDQKTFYIGMTDDLEKRIRDHQRGYSPYTRKFSDIQLAYRERYSTRIKAEEREQQLKKWSIAKKKALIAGDQNLLRKLSKGPEVGDARGSKEW